MRVRAGFTPHNQTADSLAGHLIRHAAHRATQALPGRYEEEWLALLRARPSSLARLRFALGCWWAARVITRELGVAAEPPGDASRGRTKLTRVLTALLPWRTRAFLLVLCLHVGVVYLLTQTLVFPRLPQGAAAHPPTAPASPPRASHGEAGSQASASLSSRHQ